MFAAASKIEIAAEIVCRSKSKRGCTRHSAGLGPLLMAKEKSGQHYLDLDSISLLDPIPTFLSVSLREANSTGAESSEAVPPLRVQSSESA